MAKEAALGTSGYAVASLITGVISLILGWVPILGWGVLIFTYFFAFLALRDIKKKKRRGKSLAVGGFVLAVLGTILAAIVLFAMIAGYTGDSSQGNMPAPGTPTTEPSFPEPTGAPSSGVSAPPANAGTAGTGTSGQRPLHLYSPKIIDKYAILGEPFNYSFCDPQTTQPSDLCHPLNTDLGNPRGGNPPYHFTLEHGFFQTGLILHPNGYIDGTPATAGTVSVNICAADLSGNSVCEPTSLEVVDMAVTLGSARCVLDSCGDNGVCVWSMTLTGTARGPTGSWVTPMSTGVDSIKESNPSSGTFADPSMDYTCGGWKMNPYAQSCTAPSGPGTISYSFPFKVFSRMRSITLRPSVAMGINYRSEMRFTSPKIKEVTCS